MRKISSFARRDVQVFKHRLQIKDGYATRVIGEHEVAVDARDVKIFNNCLFAHSADKETGVDYLTDSGLQVAQKRMRSTLARLRERGYCKADRLDEFIQEGINVIGLAWIHHEMFCVSSHNLREKAFERWSEEIWCWGIEKALYANDVKSLDVERNPVNLTAAALPHMRAVYLFAQSALDTYAARMSSHVSQDLDVTAKKLKKKAKKLRETEAEFKKSEVEMHRRIASSKESLNNANGEIVRLRQRIQELEKICLEKDCEIRALRKDAEKPVIDKVPENADDTISFATPHECDEPESGEGNGVNISDIFLPQKNVLFLGGHINLVNKLRTRYPDWNYLNVTERKAAGGLSERYTGTELVIIWANHLSHKLWERMRASLDGIPVIYVDATNINLLEQQMKTEYAALKL